MIENQIHKDKKEKKSTSTTIQEANQTEKKIKKPFFRKLWLIFIDVMLKQIQITTFSHYIKTEAEESF